MSKLIFCDLNESLVNKVKALFDQNQNNKWDVKLEAVCNDIFECQKQNQGYKICTASNPDFKMGGGLDKLIADKFSDEIDDPKEFSWTDNIFYTVSVNSNLQATKEIITRALIGIFGYRHKDLIFSGLGTAIGGMSEDDFVECLKNVLRYANLRRANLSSADLSSADLSYANLSYANLSSANLSSANLSSANLSKITNFFDPLIWLQKNFESDKKGLIVYKRIGNTSYTTPSDWVIKPKSIIEELGVNPLPTIDCGSGVNFATLEWCKKEYTSSDLWKCRINWIDLASVVVPYNTDGKARCQRLELLEIVKI